MEEQLNRAQLNFVNFVVPKFKFDKQIIEGETSFDLIPQAVISRKNKQFHINIDLEISDVEHQFVLKMMSVGIFNYNSKDEETLLNFMSINGPAIIFPYIRSFISNFTSLSGFDTITLPTLNLSGFKDDLIDKLIDIDEIEKENE